MGVALMGFTYRQIDYGSAGYKAACELRYQVLRKPIGMELREKDVAGEDAQLHFVAHDDAGRVMACVIFKPLEPTHIKLRQMAVADEAQGKGVGLGLVRFAETAVAALGYRTIETSARHSATGFYEKLGYAIEGDPFEEIGLHTIKMVKTL